MPKLRAERLYKVFGRRAAEAVRRIEIGEEATELRKSLGVTPAVIDADLEVQPGETFVVMGLSGSGKSTLIRMLNGLLKPTSGKVFLEGVELTSLNHKELRRVRQETVSMVFQHFALFPHRTVLENAGYALEVRKIAHEERTQKAREALQMVGLERWENSLPTQLSGGMRQRVGLARALAAETDILLMDEAFSALDPLIRREMQDQLIQLQDRLKKTIVFITHDLNEAMKIGDRIAMMRGGRIVQIGTAEDILNEPANDYVAEFVKDVDRTRVLTADSVKQDPIVTVSADSDPRAALRVMRHRHVDAAFVVGPEHQLQGVVTDDEVADAVQRGAANLLGVIKDDVMRVTPHTSIADMLIPSVESRLPLAVVNQERLIGVVSRKALLAALGTPPAVARHDQARDGSEGPGPLVEPDPGRGDRVEVDHA